MAVARRGDCAARGMRHREENVFVYKRAISLIMCLILLWGNALAVGEELTDYGSALRLADLLSGDGTTYTVTFNWEGTELVGADGAPLASPYAVSVPMGEALGNRMPALAAGTPGRVTWKNPNGEVFTAESPIHANTSLTAEIQLGYCITLEISTGTNTVTFEIYTQSAVSEDQLIAADGTDFTWYNWVDSENNPVTLLGYKPQGDVVLYGTRKVESVSRTINCMVCLNGTWVQAGTLDRVYGPDAGSGRYYLTLGQLTSVYGRYGFDAAEYANANGSWFGQAVPGQNIWSDGGTTEQNGEKVTLIFASGNDAPVFELYYMPGRLYNDATPTAAKENNRIWTVSASIPAELEAQLGVSRTLAYVPGFKAETDYTTTVELPRVEGITWSWSGGDKNTSADCTESEDGSMYVYTLKGVHVSPVVFTPVITERNVEFITEKGSYNYRVQRGTDLGQWVADHADIIIGTDATSFTGTAETRTFGELDWQHLNGSQQGTYLSPNWVIGDNEPQTLRLQGMPRERTLVFRANGGSGTVTVDLVTEDNSLSQWLEKNKEREVTLNNGVVIQLGRFVWADARNNKPIEGTYDIDLSTVRHGVSTVLNGTHRTYYTVTLMVEHLDDSKPCTSTQEVELNRNLIEWLDAGNEFVIDEGQTHAGEHVRRENYRYTLNNPTDPIPQGYTVQSDIVLYAHPRSYVGVTLEVDGHQEKTYLNIKGEGYERGMPLLQWVEAHAKDVLDNGKTVHDYIWIWDGKEITNANLIYDGSEDITLTAKEKAAFTVTFHDGDGSWKGETPKPISVLAGDRVSAEILTQMADQLTPPEGEEFIGWVYDSTSSVGETVQIAFDETVRVTSNLMVYPRFEVCHEVTFYTDSTLKVPISANNFTNPVVVPDGETIPAGAYPYERDPEWVPDGQAFRYWVKVVESATGEQQHLVFSINDKITEDMKLYPVLTRLVYIFNDADGRQLTSVYWGDQIQYVPQNIPEGKYYIGLRVGDAIIPNGTVASISELTALGVVVPPSSNGARVFEDVEPVFGDQHTVVYHADANSQFAAGQTREQRHTVNARFSTLGMADIYRVVNASSHVLAGWALTEDGEVAYGPNADVLSDDVAWDENGELHLYCVWQADENALVITYETNYPADALDVSGQRLENATYQVYIPSGSQPVLPFVTQTGFELPSNTVVVEGDPVKRYSIAGWSIHPSGQQSDDVDGVYTEGTQYAHPVNKDTTFYLRWLDVQARAEDTTAYFFIRDDGNLPQEPGFFEGSNYYPKTKDNQSEFSMFEVGALKALTNVVNDTEAVRANLVKEPSKDEILDCFKGDSNSKTYQEIKNLRQDQWYVEWYAIKFVEGKWHVDGRVRRVGTYRLDYFPNGGSNVPVSTTHEQGSYANVEFKNGVNPPMREGYRFLGWSENSWATEPDKGLEVDSTNATIHMTSDKKLYAVWAPNPITIPPLYGEKYLRSVTNDQVKEKLLVGKAGAYSVTVELESAPDGAVKPWYKSVDLDNEGCFRFQDKENLYSFTRAGTYVFAITEDIPKNADASIAYDTATYRVTIHITQGENGLEIAAAEMDRNGVKVEDFQLNNAKPAFRFTNVEGVRDVTVRKVWDDSNNAHNLRPQELTVTLLGNGEVKGTATLNADNGWTHTFENLPTKDATTGKAIEYSVREEAFVNDDKYNDKNDHEPVVSGDVNTGFVITNTYDIPTLEITVEKQWQGDASKDRPEQLDFYLVQLGPGGQELNRELKTLVPDADGKWTMMFDAPQTIYSGSGVMTVDYRVEEVVPGGYHLVGDIQKVEKKDADDKLIGYTFTVVNAAVTDVRIEKTVTGTMGDRTHPFAFTAKLLDSDGKTIPIPAPTDANAGYEVDADGIAKFTLADGEGATLKGLDRGTGYTLEITESADGYDQSYRVNDGEATEVTNGTIRVPMSDAMTVEVMNHKDAAIDTGIRTDSAPYLWMLGMGALALAIAGGRRRWRRKI